MSYSMFTNPAQRRGSQECEQVSDARHIETVFYWKIYAPPLRSPGVRAILHVNS
jgi:hypothetical protein